MDAFATADDLGNLLNRTFTDEEKTWFTELLRMASAELRGVIGQQVVPVTTSTYTAYPTAGREDLPQWPVVSVDKVERDGEPVTYTYRPGYILVRDDDPLELTFTWGHSTAPERLKDTACVLVSQALVTLENNLGLTAGGLSSVALDDFKLAWADAGAQSGMTLTPHLEASLRAQFGRGDVHTAEARE